MTNGDKIKLRAELAGKAMAAIIAKVPTRHELVSPDDDKYIHVARGAIHYADALMAELGIKGEE